MTQFKKLTICTLILALLFSFTACTSNNPEADSNSIIESSLTAESSLPPENEFDISAYTKLVEESRQAIEETAILLSNLGQYEYNYWNALNNVNGTMDYSSMVDSAFNWLLDKGNVSRDEVVQNYTTICNQYKEIIQIDIGTNSAASTIKNEYDTLYTNFDNYYRLVTDPSGDVNSFSDTFNTYTRAIESSNSKLGLLTQDSHSDSSPDNSKDSESDSASTAETSRFSVDAGFYEGDEYIYYTLVIKNNTKDQYLEYPSINVTFRDADGNLVATEQVVTFRANPGDTLAYNSLTQNNSGKPAAKIECVLTNQDAEYKQAESNVIPTNDLFEVSNVSITLGNYSNYTILGEVKNNSGKDSGSVAICTIFYKEDRIVAGQTQYLDNIPKDSSLPFSMSTSSHVMPDYDKVITLVQYW
ncbi:MAG: hypothetical protein HFE64_10655 [Lachnospiraceae bacterium]|jgi:hypothetical protein|nr:hypothetical protein [Lachnospiraceae bacterium]